MPVLWFKDLILEKLILDNFYLITDNSLVVVLFPDRSIRGILSSGIAFGLALIH